MKRYRAKRDTQSENGWFIPGGEIVDINPDDFEEVEEESLCVCDRCLRKKGKGYWSEEETRLHCNKCGKAVSSPVDKDVIVRAWLECPECIELEDETLKLIDLATFEKSVDLDTAHENERKMVEKLNESVTAYNQLQKQVKEIKEK